MQFMATLKHSADNCWARAEHEETAKAWLTSIDDRAADHNVELHGAYVTPNEHTLYFLLESDSFQAISGFLDSPFLEDHDGHIAPVLTISEVEETILAE